MRWGESQAREESTAVKESGHVGDSLEELFHPGISAEGLG